MFTSIFAIGSQLGGGEQNLYLESSILSSNEKIVAGSPILINTNIILLGEKNNKITDVVFEYFIINDKDETIYKIIETKGILLRADILKQIELPSDIEPGTYTLDVKASYNGVSKTVSNTFEVVKTRYSLISEREQIITLSIFLIIFLFVIFSFYYQQRMLKHLEKLIDRNRFRGF